MKILTKLLPFMANNDASHGSQTTQDAVDVATTAIQWVATALATIGIILVVISLIKVGIKMANADSPENAQKCKKQVVYCIIGLVILVAAEVAIPFIAGAVRNWSQENFGATALVMNLF